VSDPAEADLRWLNAATRLAMPALGTTGPMPPVGAIVADPVKATLIGSAVTELRGAGQAELLALAAAQGRTAGRTLYMTLEPPSASAAAIAEAGIFRVVVGQLDPDPAASGAGLKALNERSIVTLKITVSADGMVGYQQPGEGPPMGVEAARFVDRERAASDAVMSGIARAEIEDNDLRPHLPGFTDRSPLRVILSGGKEINQRFRLFTEIGGGPILVFTHPEHPVQLRQGINVVEVDGRRGHPELKNVVSLLATGGINRLFVEAGARLTESFISAELIDRLYVIDSAQTIGRFGVPAALRGRFQERINVARYSEVDRQMLGDDKLRIFERR
jgi:diaminohydroxyphosphoribosylaminopyrimidine deaminase/5-amino-6-(5-phosphoribosylamino)uracil reductase